MDPKLTKAKPLETQFAHQYSLNIVTKILKNNVEEIQNLYFLVHPEIFAWEE